MVDPIKIEIDGRELEAKPGQMIIEVADDAGIYIPRFCYHKELSIAANCRMCLVEVEKAPKPMPACATPVGNGMKIHTASKQAVEAQKGTMEFLLINHPLDCPICDQGGECPLQDQALGYGKDVSRFTEKKRVVDDKDIGPLIATEMTRCIHCTCCVRFGQEIAGIMELGALGRGEDMKIGTYLSNSVDSEVSGNVIDLCPVGALTSKPYRFTARSWELVNHASISPHDCVGSNINVQSIRNVVKRVLPRENEQTNGSWLSDRDRYSYEGIHSEDRLQSPMIKQKGEWKQTDWQTALEFAANGIKENIARNGANQFGTLVAPTSTLEEFYLAQKLTRGLGSGNVDHRLRWADFSDDESAPLFPAAETKISDFDKLQAVVLIGSNIRKEQPLLALRLRKAYRNGAKIVAINTLDYEFNFTLHGKQIVAPSALSYAFARFAVALGEVKNRPVPDDIRNWAGNPEYISDALKDMAAPFAEAGDKAAIVLGAGAHSNADATIVRVIAQWISCCTRAGLNILPDANSAAGWIAGCLPHRGPANAKASVKGKNAAQMVSERLKSYLLFGVEPELDCLNSYRASNAMIDAEFVVSVTPFAGNAKQYSDVLLPMGTFAETSGSYVNANGLLQSTTGCIPPVGDARPGWKILRVLANRLDVAGFDYMSSEDCANEVNCDTSPPSCQPSEWRLPELVKKSKSRSQDLERINDVPLYRTDALVRRATALQQTSDNTPPQLMANPEDLSATEYIEGKAVNVRVNGLAVTLPLYADKRVPLGCAYIPSGTCVTAPLGEAGEVRIEAIDAAATANGDSLT